MAGSIVVECRRALVTLLQTRQGSGEGLEGVQVAYGYPGDDQVEKEAIFTGRASAEHAQTSLKAGRRFRAETAQFDVLIQIRLEDETVEDIEDRAFELGLELEECVADNKYLGEVDGLNWAVVAGWEITTGMTDIGHLTQLIYSIRYNARLT